MPYIKQNERGLVDIIELERSGGDNPGTLNFCITVMLMGYFERNGGRYQQINDVMGALEGAKLEFYRRVASPYEDTKIKENGDVY